MIKLAIRITDLGAAIHVGGDPDVTTHIVEIENCRLEALLKPAAYATKSISVVEEKEG